MNPKCRHCNKVFARNHCPRCQSCNGTGHTATCPRDPDNQPHRRFNR